MAITMHKRAVNTWCVMLITVLIITGCQSKKKNTVFDSPTNGNINISVDESFKPVIDEQIKMFEASYPNAKINVHYKPEAECLKDILMDSATRLVIVTRGLNGKEEHYFQDSMDYVPRWDKIATDAIAIVVNANSTDTVFTLKRLQNQLSGRMGKKETIIFDGLSATSIVRFATDSILKGRSFDTSVGKGGKG
jgi:phosphate transport system substrate-binding protein